MSYYHFNGEDFLDQLDSFLTFLPFSIDTTDNHFTLGPDPIPSAFVTYSRRSSPPKPGRRTIGPIGTPFVSVISDNSDKQKGSRISINGLTTTVASCHVDQLSIAQCELGATEGVLPHFDLSAWTKTCAQPANPGGQTVWAHSVAAPGWTCDFLWDLSPIRMAGNGFTSELGLISPLSNTGSLTQLIQEIALRFQGVVGQKINEAFPRITISSDVLDPVTLFGQNGNGSPVTGYVAVALGAFAPPNPKSFGYRDLLSIFALPERELLDRLDGIAVENENSRSRLPSSDFGAKLGQTSPVEIIYFTQLQEAKTPAFF